MSINVTIDEATYSGVQTISAYGKTIQLKEIADSSDGGSTSAWDNASEYSLGSIIKKAGSAQKTGTFVYQSVNTEYIQMFDTGLGDTWEGIFIIDEDGVITEAATPRYAYFSYIANNGNVMLISTGLNTTIAVGSGVGNVDISNHEYLKIENGVYYAKSLYDNTDYTPFCIGHTYRWFAW